MAASLVVFFPPATLALAGILEDCLAALTFLASAVFLADAEALTAALPEEDASAVFVAEVRVAPAARAAIPGQASTRHKPISAARGAFFIGRLFRRFLSARHQRPQSSLW